MGAQLQFMDGNRGQVVRLSDEPLVIGGRSSLVRVPGSTVTREHARLFLESGRYQIEDLSGDGLWVNDNKVTRTALANRDRIRIGNLDLDFFED